MSESDETERKLHSAGDLSEQDSENCSSSSSSSDDVDTKKTCVDCGTSKTPLWRGGPAGPKSLCNACGIKSRKKRQAALGIRAAEEKKKKKKKKNRRSHNSVSNNNLGLDQQQIICNNKNDEGVGRFSDLGFRVPVMKRSTVEKKRLWRKLGEEERAAVLLMALSSASVYA